MTEGMSCAPSCWEGLLTYVVHLRRELSHCSLIQYYNTDKASRKFTPAPSSSNDAFTDVEQKGISLISPLNLILWLFHIHKKDHQDLSHDIHSVMKMEKALCTQIDEKMCPESWDICFSSRRQLHLSSLWWLSAASRCISKIKLVLYDWGTIYIFHGFNYFI